MAFCVVALLFLVTQELLIEAQAYQCSSLKLISMFLFIGVVLFLFAEKIIEAVEGGPEGAVVNATMI